MPSADVYRGLRPAGAGHHAGLIGESPGVLAAQSRPWRLQAHGFPVPSKEWMSPLAVAEPPRVRSGAAVSLVTGRLIKVFSLRSLCHYIASEPFQGLPQIYPQPAYVSFATGMPTVMLSQESANIHPYRQLVLHAPSYIL